MDNIKKIKIVKVAVEGTTYYIDKLYSYIVPEQLYNNVDVGKRVIIPFGKGNKKKVGVILEVEICINNNTSPYFTHNGFAIKPIVEVIDNKSILNCEMVMVIYWLKTHTFCKYFDAVKTIVPTGLNVKFFTKYKVSKKLTDAIYSKLSTEEKLLIDSLKNVQNNLKNNLLLLESLNENQKIIVNKLLDQGLILQRDGFERKIKDKKSVMVKLTSNFYSNIEDIENNYKLTPKQKKVINVLIGSETASLKEVLYLCGVTKSVLDSLEKREIIKYFEIEEYRTQYNFSSNCSKEPIKLNSEQQNVLKKLIDLVQQTKPNIALLRGVTGSGKTLIFIELIKHVISQGRQVILLVPEISLTPQMVNTLNNYFSEDIAVLHSGLTLSNRLDEWKRINNNQVKIVLGTRSAIFSPLNNIGLIIMDEEQEMSYQSENSPRYHTRDIAKIRATYNKALFLMASATPSVETYYYMKKNSYTILELNKRYNNVSLPKISVIDMTKEKLNGNNTFFSEKLVKEIDYNLKNAQQSILFINRRGYNTVVRCSECGNVETCPNCSIAMTYHKTNNQLMCHYCGYSKDVIKKCSKCGSSYLQYGGVGTQKIEAQLSTIFPEAKILRLDSDTTMERFSYDKHFKDFLLGKYQILIGTQMVAKGLNFPNVTLVGVVDGDQSIYSSDYKAIEKTYDVITQVIGRSGRDSVGGRAIIQTNSIDNDIFEVIANQQYNEFFDREILLRKKLLYPPFCDMAIIGITGINEDIVFDVSKKVFDVITQLISKEYSSVPLKMFGPVPETISKINNKYRYKIILKYKNSNQFRKMINDVFMKITKNKFKENVNIFVEKI